VRGTAKWIWLCLLLVQLVGCRGCSQQKTTKETEEEAEAKRKKQRLVSTELKALPFSADTPGSVLKSSHWYQGNQKLKANFADESLTAKLSVINREKKNAPFAPGQAYVDFHRNVSLGERQEKSVQFRFFQPEVPVTGDELTKTPSALKILYSQRGIGTPVLEEEFLCRTLPGYQYNMVSLSRDSSRYLFWRALDCIIWPSKQRMSDERVTPHRVIDLNEDELATQFPDRLYAMTSISHFVINDSSVSIMSADQQQALQDWLYFGGTIILNGPEAIGGIESSFMRDYSPLVRTTNAIVSEREIAMLNETWSIEQLDNDKLLFEPPKSIPKLAGDLAAGAQWVKYRTSSGEMASLDGLVAERLIGQGRVVMTTFPLTDIAFLRWPSYSSFIHNAILAKPHRSPSLGDEADLKFANEYEGTELNPIHSTRMRIWARDLDESTTRKFAASVKKTGTDEQDRGYKDASAEFAKLKRTSFGAWNPDSTILANARHCLQQSSGITVPKINTIVKLLAGYLIILVPVNWLFFRLFGRVELAWAAAPVIALVGAFVVARSVQLDVGFSRSQTSYGFLELHNGYARGNFSSYTALYSSLSTNYRAVFEKDTGVVLPFASTSGSQRSRNAIGKIDYWFAGDAGAGMQSVPVLSNTTGLFQAEEMVSFPGKLTAEFDKDRQSVEIKNGLGLPFKEAGIFGVDSQGKFVSSWLGTLEDGFSKRCDLVVRETDDRWRKEWDQSSILSRPTYLRAEDGAMWTEQDLQDELYLGPMLEEVAKKYPLARGEFIAIGWSDQQLGDLTITPVAKQKKLRSVVLFHLSAPDQMVASPDTSIFPKVIEEADGNTVPPIFQETEPTPLQ
jgi:hypothetical protein